MSQLYADNILDLYKHPLNEGRLNAPSATHRAYNPLCGDDITIDLLIENHRIIDIRHRSIGCAISQASASLMTEEVKGQELQQILKIKPDQVIEMLGVDLGPVRLKCALLNLEAIHQAIIHYQTSHAQDHTHS